MTKQIFKVLVLLVTLSFSPNVQSASYNYQEESWVEKDKNKQSKRNARIKSIMKTLGVAACVAAICALGYKFMGKSGKKSDPKTSAEVPLAPATASSHEPAEVPATEIEESSAEAKAKLAEYRAAVDEETKRDLVKHLMKNLEYKEWGILF